MTTLPWKTRIITTKKGKKRRLTNPYWKHVKKTDTQFSLLVRLLAADENGIVECFTCGKKDRWQHGHMECGHYKPRGNMNTRWDIINNNVQCAHPNQDNCNRDKGGNIKVYRQNLIMLYGVKEVENLESRSAILKIWTIDEMRELRKEFAKQVKLIRKEKGL